MQAAHRSLISRVRVVVLHEVDVDPKYGERFSVICLNTGKRKPRRDQFKLFEKFYAQVCPGIFLNPKWLFSSLKTP